MSSRSCVMPRLLVSPQVILATESSLQDPHLMVLEMLNAVREEEQEHLTSQL